MFACAQQQEGFAGERARTGLQALPDADAHLCFPFLRGATRVMGLIAGRGRAVMTAPLTIRAAIFPCLEAQVDRCTKGHPPQEILAIAVRKRAGAGWMMA